MNDMCRFADIRYEDGLIDGRAEANKNWLRQTVEALKELKTQGLLNDRIWKAFEKGCPDKSLLPKLREAVGY